MPVCWGCPRRSCSCWAAVEVPEAAHPHYWHLCFQEDRMCCHPPLRLPPQGYHSLKTQHESKMSLHSRGKTRKGANKSLGLSEAKAFFLSKMWFQQSHFRELYLILKNKSKAVAVLKHGAIILISQLSCPIVPNLFGNLIIQGYNTVCQHRGRYERNDPI